MTLLLLISGVFAIAAIGLWSGSRSDGTGQLVGQPAGLMNHGGTKAVPLTQVVVKGRSASRQIFIIGLLGRVGAYAILVATGAMAGGISRDSLRYHEEGIRIAKQYIEGGIIWSNWIDDGWFEFTGLVYSFLGADMFWIQLFNIFIGAITGVLTYLIASKVYNNEPVARFAGYATALFPSFIYYSAIPLKDTASLMALLLMVWSAVNLRDKYSLRYAGYIVLSLLIVLALRDYLFFVCLALLAVSFGPVSSRRIVRYITLMAGGGMLLGCVAYTLGFGFFGLDFLDNSRYFDIDYINQTRTALNRGRGHMFSDPASIEWGSSWFNDVKNLLMGVYFFFFSIDPTDVTRARQWFALPEMLVLLLAFSSIVRGVAQTWRHKRQYALPVMIFAFGIMAVYSSATTNMGAMFRWRMQALPFFMMMASYGIYLRQRGALFRVMRFFARG